MKRTKLYRWLLLMKSSKNNFVFLTAFYLTICLMKTSIFFSNKLWFEMKRTKLYQRMSLVKGSKNNFIFLPVFYLIMCLMKASKNFGKIAILKIWELIFLGDVKTHFGKLALKWSFFRNEKKYSNWYYVIVLDPIRM